MSGAQRYHLRAPRYVLKSAELRHMRFASMETRGLSTATEVMNLSETGLAFQMETGLPPDEGDVLKVEFPIPGEAQIACFATVVRVDEYTDWDPKIGARRFNVVGLKFRHLPEGHRRILRRGLDGHAAAEHTSEGTPENKSVELQANGTDVEAVHAARVHSLRSLILPLAGATLGLVPLMYVMTVPISVIVSAIRSLVQ